MSSAGQRKRPHWHTRPPSPGLLLVLGHNVHRIRALNGLPTPGLTGQRSHGAGLVQVQFPGLEVEQQIQVAVAVRYYF